MAGQALAPIEIDRMLRSKFRLLGATGLLGIALAAIDMAVWDALARSLHMPLVGLLGGAPKPIPAYGAVGHDGVDGSARTRRGMGNARHSRHQGQDRIPDGGRRRGGDSRHAPRGRRLDGDHGGLQPESQSGRCDRAHPRARRRGTGVGGRAHAGRRLRRPRDDRARSPARRSSAARTGGGRPICSTPSTHRRRTSSWPTR